VKQFVQNHAIFTDSNLLRWYTKFMFS